jgi:gluconolactonase
MKRILIPAMILVVASACQPKNEMKTIGTIERADPALDSIISPDARIEIVAEGFDWSEGPLWLESQKAVIFSDIPQNTIFKWTEEKGKEVYLKPAGYTGQTPRGGELGSNGLLLNDEGNLVLCQHGDRRLATMLAPIDAPKSEFQTIADKWNGKRFNSPNDAIFHNYDYFLTDPAYGMEKQFEDPGRETPFCGVYRVAADGTVTLLTDSLSRPNGIAFSPDGNYLFVANSDPGKAIWMKYAVKNDSPTFALGEGKVLYDATSLVATQKGLPDGMKIDSKGNIFATGPGGVFIFNLDGKLLGKIAVPDPTSNCALTSDEKTLFVTNDMYLLRIKLRN